MRDTRNVRLTVAYDGTDFRGFAESDGVRTVMGELRRAVETVARRPVELTGAGRTDAGVHGWGQVVSGELPTTTDLRRLERSINGLCGPDISVRDVEWADDDVLGAVLCCESHLPVPRLERSGAESAAGAHDLACPPAPRRRRDEHRRRATARRTRLLVVLPSTEARRRVRTNRAWCATCTLRAGRSPTRAGVNRCFVSRSRPRRSAIRWCAASSARSSTWGSDDVRPTPWRPRSRHSTATPRGKLRRRRAWCCGRSTTAENAGTPERRLSPRQAR